MRFSSNAALLAVASASVFINSGAAVPLIPNLRGGIAAQGAPRSLILRRDSGTSLASTFAGPLSDMNNALSDTQSDLTRVAVNFGAMAQAVNDTNSPNDPQLIDTFDKLLNQIQVFSEDVNKMLAALTGIENGLNQPAGVPGVSGSSTSSTANGGNSGSTDPGNTTGDGNSDNGLPF